MIRTTGISKNYIMHELSVNMHDDKDQSTNNYKHCTVT